MRAASTAAFFALSTPTVATGTPGGICTIESSASRPSRTRIDERSGTPITGSSVCAATTPGSAAASPAPQISTLRPRVRPRPAYSATASGVRCAERTSNSHAIRARRARRARACIRSRSDSEPTRMPTSGVSHRTAHRRDVASHWRRRTRRVDRLVRALPRLARRRPSAVTESTRPPSSRARPSLHRRAAVEDERARPPRPRRSRRSARPRSRCAPGSRARRATTVTARLARQRDRGAAQVPCAAAASALEQVAFERAASAPASPGRRSGVELQHPRPVRRSASAGVEAADERRARGARARRAPAGGSARRAPSTSRRARRPASRRPCRRCSGPSSPSPIRLKSCAAPSGERAAPSQSAKTETSGPSSSSSTTTRSPSAATASSAASTSSAVRQTKTPLPAASPSALTTHGALARSEARGRRHAGRVHHVLRERLRALDPRRRRARPEHGDPAWRSTSATPATSGASGPDHDEVGVERRREAEQPVAVVGAHGMALAEAGDARVARRGVQLGQRGLRARRHASACSRAPDPTSSTFTARVYFRCLTANRFGALHARADTGTRRARVGDRVGADGAFHPRVADTRRSPRPTTSSAGCWRRAASRSPSGTAKSWRSRRPCASSRRRTK